MQTYIEDRTQEDIAELHAAHGLGCKSCERPIAPGTARACEGDIYCKPCGAKLKRLGATVVILPNRKH